MELRRIVFTATIFCCLSCSQKNQKVTDSTVIILPSSYRSISFSEQNNGLTFGILDTLVFTGDSLHRPIYRISTENDYGFLKSCLCDTLVLNFEDGYKINGLDSVNLGANTKSCLIERPKECKVFPESVYSKFDIDTGNTAWITINLKKDSILAAEIISFIIQPNNEIKNLRRHSIVFTQKKYHPITFIYRLP